MPKAKKVKTPYEQLFDQLVDAGAQCLHQIVKKDTSHQFNLEFWSVRDPKPGRLVIVQHWTDGRGGFDAFVPIRSHKTAEAIVEVVGQFLPALKHDPVGVGPCRVCGHDGFDCTGKSTPEDAPHEPGCAKHAHGANECTCGKAERDEASGRSS